MRVAALAVALVLWALPAGAQVCAGRGAFNAYPRQAGASAASTGARSEISALAAAGTDRVFGLASIARGWSAASDDRSIALSAGTDQALTLDNRLHACPLLTVGHRRVAADGTVPARAGATVTATLRVGYLAANRRRAAIIPTAFLSIAREPWAEGVGRTLSAGAGLGVIRLRRMSIGVEAATRWTRHTRDASVSGWAVYGW